LKGDKKINSKSDEVSLSRNKEMMTRKKERKLERERERVHGHGTYSKILSL